MAVTLYHYTCAHAALGLGRRGVLRPNPQPFLDGLPMVWLTDLEEPDRVGLGLSSDTLRCDRTEYRYRVTHSPGAAVPWRVFAEEWHIDRTVRATLELGRRARHWWVSVLPVEVRR